MERHICCIEVTLNGMYGPKYLMYALHSCIEHFQMGDYAALRLDIVSGAACQVHSATPCSREPPVRGHHLPYRRLRRVAMTAHRAGPNTHTKRFRPGDVDSTSLGRSHLATSFLHLLSLSRGHKNNLLSVLARFHLGHRKPELRFSFVSCKTFVTPAFQRTGVLFSSLTCQLTRAFVVCGSNGACASLDTTEPFASTDNNERINFVPLPFLSGDILFSMDQNT